MSEPTVLFESWRGRYADSPRRVSERLATAWPTARRVWVTAGNDEFPDGEILVRRHGVDYFRRLLTTDVLFANDIISRHVLKGPGVTYVQMWHGTPLKLIGHDERAHAYSGAAAHLRRMDRDVAKWDVLVSPSPACTSLLRSAFGYTGEVWETGYPRNDVLHSADAPRIRERVRERLGIAPDSLAVLLAPTWRDDDKTAGGQFRQSVLPDFDLLRSELPPGSRLLLRTHKNVTVPTGVGDPGFVLDVSSWPEIADLYLAADVLVSDYSSAVYDFAVTRKPIVLFAPDLDRYRDAVRGFYFDYDTWAPGPVTMTSSDLAARLSDLDEVQVGHKRVYDSFVERFCPHEDGRAAERVVDLLRSTLAR